LLSPRQEEGEGREKNCEPPYLFLINYFNLKVERCKGINNQIWVHKELGTLNVDKTKMGLNTDLSNIARILLKITFSSSVSVFSTTSSLPLPFLHMDVV
jgi:hypothetical protein